MKKKIFILGVNGMIGYSLFKYLEKNDDFETYGFLRDKKKFINNKNIILNNNIKELNCLDINKMRSYIMTTEPEFIINCTGIVKQNPLINNIALSIELNSLFPHYLSNMSRDFGFKLIQFSTDCVFSGKSGNYKEEDCADAVDIYGRTKFLGEVKEKNCITIRTSFIGHELFNKWGLISWFLSQKNPIIGFKNVIYSGLTTLEIAKIIEKLIIPNKKLEGLYHISSIPIDKYSLLQIINNIYQKNIYIKKDLSNISDKSLNSYKFKNETGYKAIEWETAIGELKDFYELNYI
tara:strand:+ start:2353 stop:3228 length:876 start_codon:yes stop_codon:yes gene_type:complete